MILGGHWRGGLAPVRFFPRDAIASPPPAAMWVSVRFRQLWKSGSSGSLSRSRERVMMLCQKAQSLHFEPVTGSAGAVEGAKGEIGMWTADIVLDGTCAWTNNGILLVARWGLSFPAACENGAVQQVSRYRAFLGTGLRGRKPRVRPQNLLPRCWMKRSRVWWDGMWGGGDLTGQPACRGVPGSFCTYVRRWIMEEELLLVRRFSVVDEFKMAFFFWLLWMLRMRRIVGGALVNGCEDILIITILLSASALRDSLR